MKDYLKRFVAILGVMVGILAVLGGFCWLIAQAFVRFGLFGGVGAILVLSCAIAATMPEGGRGPL